MALHYRYTRAAHAFSARRFGLRERSPTHRAARAPVVPFTLSTEDIKQYRRERDADARLDLQIALFLGAAGFFAFALLDLLTRDLSLTQYAGRNLVDAVLVAMLIHLRHMQANGRAFDPSAFAIAAAFAAAADLIVIVLVEQSASTYPEAWPGVVPVYFLTYGRLILSIRAAIVFGAVTMFAFPTAGFAIGAAPPVVASSALMLAIVNLFGLLTRCQLEAYSRQSFATRREAERATIAKTEFIRQASHNLRQPLQALSCYASVLEDNLVRVRLDDALNNVRRLGSTTDALNESFNRILELINLETGKQELRIESVNIDRVLASLEPQFAPQARRKGLRLRLIPSGTNARLVRTDDTSLRQVLWNLIDNAIKYTRNGWVLIAVRIPADGLVDVEVRDTGCGVPAEQATKIFEAFYRCNRRINDVQAHGLGIGLAHVAAALARLDGHTIKLNAKRGRGSNFVLRMPAAVEPMVATPEPVSFAGLAGLNILIVDDDPDVLQALTEQLGHWNCHVWSSSGLPELNALLDDLLIPPDLLICDYLLDDGQTAHDVLALIADAFGTIPTLILSAHGIPDADKQRWPASLCILRKPAAASQLQQALGKLLPQTCNRPAEEVVTADD